MFLDYYGLREQPFGVTPNPDYLYLSETHREALASLLYGVEADLGFSALVADPGMGKTTLLFSMLERYRHTARTAFLFNTQCSSRDLLRYIVREFEIETEDDKDPVHLHEVIVDFLLRNARAGRRVLIVIDEAQNLQESVLETVRLLSDFETRQKKLLHIVLAGQPAFGTKLERPVLAQLAQRITILTRLAPLSAADVHRYVKHRLQIAGYRDAPLFTDAALSWIARESRGIPRNVNRICFHALSLGCALERRALDLDVLREVRRDLDLSNNGAEPQPAENNFVEQQSPGAPPEITTIADAAAAAAPAEEPPVAVPAAAAAPAAEPRDPELAAVRDALHVSLPGRNEPRTLPASIPVRRATVPPPKRVVARKRSRLLPLDRVPRAPWIAVGLFVVLLGGGLLLRTHAPASTSPASASGSDQPAEASTPQSTPSTTAATQPSLATAPKNDASTPALPNGSPISAAPRAKKPLSPTQAAPPVSYGTGFALPASAPRPAVRPPENDNDVPAPNLTASSARSDPAALQALMSSARPVVPEAPPAAPAQPTTAPVLVRRVVPRYPRTALETHTEGMVELDARIDREGHVTIEKVLSGNPLLQQAAIEAVRQWRYRPSLLDGKPVETTTTIRVQFKLGQQ